MARPINLHRLTGRPTRYTIEVAAEILQRMSDGEPLHRICNDPDRPDLPSDNTVRGWADSGKHPGFAEAFRRARQHQAHRWFEETVALADESQCAETVPQLGSYQLRVNARRWAASRIIPEEYGERVPPAAGGGATIHIYLPGKADRGDSARVVSGTAERLEDQSED
jgi:hypothetical protein